MKKSPLSVGIAGRSRAGLLDLIKDLNGGGDAAAVMLARSSRSAAETPAVKEIADASAPMQTERSQRMPRKMWGDTDTEYLKKHYPDVAAQRIADVLGFSVFTIRRKAEEYGIRKSAAFFKSADSAGAKCKGRKYPGAQKRDPIGTEKWWGRYLYRKVSYVGRIRGQWRPVHVLMWEEAHGPVPAGYVVCFRDADPSHLALDNFECITQAEKWQRYSVHNLPEDLKRVIHLKGEITKTINRRMKNEEHD